MFRTAYGEKVKVGKDFTGDKGMTKQSMKQECDINFILARFQKTGMIEHRKQYEGDYSEFGAIDFHTAMNIVAEANSMFESVPSTIRKRFDNDPQKFLDFVQDEKNRNEAIELGIIPKPDEVINDGNLEVPGDPGPGPEPV